MVGNHRRRPLFSFRRRCHVVTNNQNSSESWINRPSPRKRGWLSRCVLYPGSRSVGRYFSWQPLS